MFFVIVIMATGLYCHKSLSFDPRLSTLEVEPLKLDSNFNYSDGTVSFEYGVWIKKEVVENIAMKNGGALGRASKYKIPTRALKFRLDQIKQDGMYYWCNKPSSVEVTGSDGVMVYIVQHENVFGSNSATIDEIRGLTPADIFLVDFLKDEHFVWLESLPKDMCALPRDCVFNGIPFRVRPFSDFNDKQLRL